MEKTSTTGRIISEKELEAKTKEFDENDIKGLIEKHMGKPYEEIDSHEIAMSRPHEKMDRNVRIAIVKWLQKEFEEDRELGDLHFKAAITAGLVGKVPEP